MTLSVGSTCSWHLTTIQLNDNDLGFSCPLRTWNFSHDRAEMAPDKYWRTPPEPLLSAASLVEFVVLDCEPVNNYASAGGGSGGGGKKAGAGGPTEKTQLWEAVVCACLCACAVSFRQVRRLYDRRCTPFVERSCSSNF